ERSDLATCNLQRERSDSAKKLSDCNFYSIFQSQSEKPI
ncbi:MAG: hypothetical protein ACI81P_002745, partial [Neolewinella sp.]